MAYDEKYRGAAVEFKDSGHTFEELQEVFGVSNSTYYRWKTIKNTTGGYTQKLAEPPTRKRKIDSEKLKVLLEHQPDAYLRELAEIFRCSATAVYKKLKKLHITLKKRRSPTPKNRKKITRIISKK